MSAPTEAPLSRRKALLLKCLIILWLSNITLHHHVRQMHNLCKQVLRTSTLLVLAQTCVNWPIRGGLRIGYGGGGLKETGAKTERFQLRGSKVLQCWMWVLSVKACKPILSSTQIDETSFKSSICDSSPTQAGVTWLSATPLPVSVSVLSLAACWSYRSAVQIRS